MQIIKEQKEQNIQFTVFASVNQQTAKSYDISEAGELIKLPIGNFWKGVFQTEEIPYSHLSDYLDVLEPGDFITQGVHHSLSNGVCPNDATRTKEEFQFSDKPGIICVDSDSVEEFGIASIEELNDALNKIDPGLKRVHKVMSTSASSNISIDGIEKNGIRGVHTFIPIDKTINNKAILEIWHKRSVIAGYGYAKVTKAGIVKINSLFDKALGTSNQPIFEGGAILSNDKRLKQHGIIVGFSGNLLLADSVLPITDQEEADYKRKCVELTAQVQAEATLVRQEYTSTATSRINKRNEKLTEQQSLEIFNQAIDHNRLPAEFIILLESGEEVAVQEILDNPKKYHEVACAHPLDNEILGKSIIYSNQEKPIIYSFAHGGETFFLGPDSEEAVMDWSIALKEFVLNFNETHAQVMIGGKHRIMRTVAAEIHHESRTSFEFIKQEELRKVYANDQIQVGEKITGEMVVPILKDKISAWTNHENSITYKGGVVFAPGKQLPDDYYNSWQGFAIEPISGANIDIIKKHIELIICKGERQLIEYFYNWIAYTFQYPDRPAGSALVLRGEKGCGKGSIGHFLRKIWGQHGIHISNPKHLTGNFNAHLADICFLFADEAFFSGDKQHEGVLKALITEPTLMIERKGLDADLQPNYLKIFMVTNNDHAVPTSKDERRYCIFDVSSERIGDRKYFDALLATCNDEAVQATFLYEMLNRNILNFHPGDIPETQGLKDQRLESLHSGGKWLVDSLTQGYFSYKDDNNKSWLNEMTSENIYSSYISWCDSQKITRRMSHNLLSRYLTRIFGSSKKLKGDNRGYVFGSLLEAISKLENYEKIDLGLMADDDSLHLDTFEASNDESISSEFNFGMIAERVAPLRVVR